MRVDSTELLYRGVRYKLNYNNISKQWEATIRPGQKVGLYSSKVIAVDDVGNVAEADEEVFSQLGIQVVDNYGRHTLALQPRTTAKQRVFPFDFNDGTEYWSAVVTKKYTLNAGETYTIAVPTRGTFAFTPTETHIDVTSFDISVSIVDNTHITPEEVSILDKLYPASTSSIGTPIFGGEYEIELKDFEYAEGRIFIDKVAERRMEVYTDAKGIEMGEIRKVAEHTFTYDGDAETGVVMILKANAEVDDIRIYDIITGEYFAIDATKIETITGTKFDYGDEIHISTVSGDKYVRLLRNGIWTNIINCVDRGSTWFVVRPGLNTFAYNVDTGLVNLDFKITYNVAYQGV